MHIAGSGDRQYDLRAFEQPRDRNLATGRAETLRNFGERRIRTGKFTGGEWKPWDESDAIRVAVVEHGFAVSIDQVVEVLHGRNREVFLCGLDVVDADFAKTGVAN